MLNGIYIKNSNDSSKINSQVLMNIQHNVGTSDPNEVQNEKLTSFSLLINVNDKN